MLMARSEPIGGARHGSQWTADVGLEQRGEIGLETVAVGGGDRGDAGNARRRLHVRVVVHMHIIERLGKSRVDAETE
jgi:hypothetical protein